MCLFSSPFHSSSPPPARPSDLVCLLQLLRYVLEVRAYREGLSPYVSICCVIRAVSGLIPVLLSK